MIIGIGIDISQIDVIRGPLEEAHGAFVEGTFTAREIKQCREKTGSSDVQNFAGKYAAKEALIKALGPSYRNITPDMTTFDYREIEILTDAVSGPQVTLSGRLAEIQRKTGFTKIWVSISHESQNAVAMVVLEK